MNILLSGCDGHVARSLAPALLSDGHNICGVDNILTRQYPFDNYRLDIRDAAIKKLLSKSNALIHCAYIVTLPTKPLATRRHHAYAVNVTGTKQLYDWAATAGIETIVHVSSTAVYDAFATQPFTETTALKAPASFWYARHKIQVEHWLDEFENRWPHINVIRLRPAMILGPNAQKIFATLLNNPWYPRHMRGAFQCLWETDFSSAVLKALRLRTNAKFNLAGEGARDIAKIKTALHGRARAIPAVLIPLWARLHGIKPDAGLSDWIHRLRVPMLLDCTAAHERLSWRPTHTTAECIRAYAATLARCDNLSPMLG